MTKVVIQVREIPQPQKFEPEIKVVFQTGDIDSGPGSYISWENRATVSGFREMFSARSDEVLTSITLTRSGIQATFRTSRTLAASPLATSRDEPVPVVKVAKRTLSKKKRRTQS